MAVIASMTEELAGTTQLDVERLAEDAQRALDAIDRGEWELSLLLCDDAFIRPLNEQWRGKDAATDVLSFPQLELDGPIELDAPAVPGTLMGDVVISGPTAARQAEELGHPVDQELRVLMVHGICHLLGHTHGTDAERAAMIALEGRLLAAMGLEAPGLVSRAAAAD